MIYIDDIEFELIMPQFLIDYLDSKNLRDVFVIENGNYYLVKDIKESDKNIVLDMCLHLIFNEVGQNIMCSSEYMKAFESISRSIHYIDRRAKFMAAKGNLERANKILKDEICDIYKFKLKIRKIEESHKFDF